MIYLILGSLIFASPIIPARAAYVWQQVGGNGLGDLTNTTIASMEVWNNALYAGIGNNAGPRIYRSTDGATWTKVNNDGFGLPNLREIYDFTPFDGRLYASALDDQHDDTPGEIWRTTNGTVWTQAGAAGLGNLSNRGFYKMAVFNGMLYVGSRNPTQGGEILRSNDGVIWNQVNVDGFGSANNDAIMSLGVFGGYLYAGTLNPTTGAELWRSANGTVWELVIDFDPYPPPGGLNVNAGINVIYVYQNDLYFGTVNPLDGAQLWQWDGAVWTGVTDGLGDNDNIWLSIHPVTVGSSVYFGTRNEVTGAQFWTANGDWDTYSQPLTGFENPNNWALYALTFKDYLYLGYSNDNGIQIWRRLVTSDFLIITKSLADGTQGQSYSSQVQADHGNLAYYYRLLSGQLPPGLFLNENTGEISGNPTKPGDYRFEIEARDSSRTPERARKIFTLKIIAGASNENSALNNVTILPETGADLISN